jgi:hypothetical protein
MLKRIKLILIAPILFLCTATLTAQVKYDPAETARIIAPFIDAQTIAVAHADISRINSDAIFEKVTGVALKIAEPQEKDKILAVLTEFRQIIHQWITDFTAAGGKDIYLVLSLTDLPRFFMIVPLGTGADAQEIANLLRKAQPAGSSEGSPIYLDCFEKFGNVAFGGSKETLQRLQTSPPADRPELSAAFAAAGDTAVQLLIILDADARRVIDETLPILAQLPGDISATAVSRGLMWAALGLDAPPKMQIKLEVQSQNATDADALNNVVGQIIDIIVKQNKYLDLKKHLTLLKPTVKGDRLHLLLKDDQIDSLMADIFLPASLGVGRAGELVNRKKCIDQLRGLGQAIMMYQNDYREKCPPNLETLIEKANVHPRMILCPSSNEKYVYRGADLTSHASSNMILAYDKLEYHQGECRNVVFCGTQVESMTQEEFCKAIELDNELRRKMKLPEKPAE